MPQVPQVVAKEISRPFLRFLMSIASGGEGFASLHFNKTLTSGATTASDEYPFQFITLDTEGGAATDDFTTLNRGKEGFCTVIQAANDSRTVVCKDGTSLKLGADFSLDHSTDKIFLICISAGVWHELFRSSNA